MSWSATLLTTLLSVACRVVRSHSSYDFSRRECCAEPTDFSDASLGLALVAVVCLAQATDLLYPLLHQNEQALLLHAHVTNAPDQSLLNLLFCLQCHHKPSWCKRILPQNFCRMEPELSSKKRQASSSPPGRAKNKIFVRDDEDEATDRNELESGQMLPSTGLPKIPKKEQKRFNRAKNHNLDDVDQSLANLFAISGEGRNTFATASRLRASGSSSTAPHIAYRCQANTTYADEVTSKVPQPSASAYEKNLGNPNRIPLGPRRVTSSTPQPQRFTTPPRSQTSHGAFEFKDESEPNTTDQFDRAIHRNELTKYGAQSSTKYRLIDEADIVEEDVIARSDYEELARQYELSDARYQRLNKKYNGICTNLVETEAALRAAKREIYALGSVSPISQTSESVEPVGSVLLVDQAQSSESVQTGEATPAQGIPSSKGQEDHNATASASQVKPKADQFRKLQARNVELQKQNAKLSILNTSFRDRVIAYASELDQVKWSNKGANESRLRAQVVQLKQQRDEAFDRTQQLVEQLEQSAERGKKTKKAGQPATKKSSSTSWPAVAIEEKDADVESSFSKKSLSIAESGSDAVKSNEGDKSATTKKSVAGSPTRPIEVDHDSDGREDKHDEDYKENEEHFIDGSDINVIDRVKRRRKPVKYTA